MPLQPSPPSCPDRLAGIWRRRIHTHPRFVDWGDDEGWSELAVRIERTAGSLHLSIAAHFGASREAEPLVSCQQPHQPAQAAYIVRWHAVSAVGGDRDTFLAITPTDSSVDVRCGPAGWVPRIGPSFRGSMRWLDEGQMDFTWTDSRRGFTHLGLVRSECLGEADSVAR